MGRGTIAALLIFGLATPAYAGEPCEPAPQLCRAKKDKGAQTSSRKPPRPDVCVKRYALM